MKSKFAFAAILTATLVLAFFSQARADFYSEKMTQVAQQEGTTWKITIYAEKKLDPDLLFLGVLDTDDAASARKKVDENRKTFYPDDQLAAEVTPISGSFAGWSEYMGVVQELYWWNNVNSYGAFWYAIYDANVAVMYTTVKSGRYDIYRFNAYNDNNWSYTTTTAPGQTDARWIAGSYNAKGFGGVGQESYNTADVVMLFFE